MAGASALPSRTHRCPVAASAARVAASLCGWSYVAVISSHLGSDAGAAPDRVLSLLTKSLKNASVNRIVGLKTIVSIHRENDVCPAKSSNSPMVTLVHLCEPAILPINPRVSTSVASSFRFPQRICGSTRTDSFLGRPHLRGLVYMLRVPHLHGALPRQTTPSAHTPVGSGSKSVLLCGSYRPLRTEYAFQQIKLARRSLRLRVHPPLAGVDRFPFSRPASNICIGPTTISGRVPLAGLSALPTRCPLTYSPTRWRFPRLQTPLGSTCNLPLRPICGSDRFRFRPFVNDLASHSPENTSRRPASPIADTPRAVTPASRANRRFAVSVRGGLYVSSSFRNRRGQSRC